MHLPKLLKFCILILCISTTFILEASSQKKEQINVGMSTINAMLVPCPQTAESGTKNSLQLIIKIYVDPKTKSNTSELFFKLEEAYDPKKRKKGKLSFPYLIEVTRGESVMMYPLQFSESVNIPGKSQAKINNQQKTVSTTDNKSKVAQPKPTKKPKCKEKLEKQPKSSAEKRQSEYNDSNSSFSKEKGDHGPAKNVSTKFVQQNVGNCTTEPVLPRLTELISRTQSDYLNKTRGNLTKTESGSLDSKPSINQTTTSTKEIEKVPPKTDTRNDCNFNIELCGQLKIIKQDNENKYTNHETTTEKNRNITQVDSRKNLKQTNHTNPKLESNAIPIFDQKSHVEQEENEKEQRKVDLKNNLIALLRQTEIENEYKMDEKRNAFNDQTFRQKSAFNNPYLDYNERYTEDEFSKGPYYDTEVEETEFDPLDEFNYYDNGQKHSNHLPSSFSKVNLNEKLPSAYEAIINDPLLSYTQKLKAMRGIPPTVSEIKRKYDTLLREFNIDLDTTLQDSVEIKSKRKRSFFMYDDLENGDTLEDDDIFKKFDIRSTNTANEDDTESCNSCGGKKKKPPPCNRCDYGTSNSIANLAESDSAEYMCTTCSGNSTGLLCEVNNCGCRTSKTPCICGTLKTSRSTKDSWYSIYKMNSPLPFVTTKIRIFRKCQNTWWSLIPAITLNSLSAMYANDNMSIVLSSRMNVYHLENSLNLPQYQLLIPKSNQSCRSQRENSQKTDLGIDFDLDEINQNPELILTLRNEEFSKISKRDVGADMNMLAPAKTKILAPCFHRKRSVCLNVLDDKSTAYTIKIQLPFTDNFLVYHPTPKIKITRAITDATMRDVLSITVGFVNEGVHADELQISVESCVGNMPINSRDVQLTTKKLLYPYVEDQYIFRLPLVVQSTSFSCKVLVNNVANRNKRSPNSKEDTLAEREMLVKKWERCFCIWMCKCHCMPKLETFVDAHSCKRMSTYDLSLAGFGKSNDSHSYQIFIDFLIFTGALIGTTFLIGLFKASIGYWVSRVDKYGYEHVEFGRSYNESSKTRRFLINTFFLILLPCSFCCKCCKPLAEKFNFFERRSRQTGGEVRGEYQPCAEESEEETIIERSVQKNVSIQRSSSSVLNLPSLEDLFDDEDDDDDSSTRYILQALSESRQTMNTLLSKHSSQKIEGADELENARFKQADDYVRSLLNAQIVYRVFNEPIGDLISIPAGIKYCMRGYFLPALGPAYEFVNYSPLAQYICMSTDGCTLAKLHPPAYLNSKHFERKYKNKYDVFEVGDLKVDAPEGVPCLNVSPFKILPETVLKFVMSDRSKVPQTAVDAEAQNQDSSASDVEIHTETLNYSLMNEKLYK